MGCFWSKRADGGNMDVVDPTGITISDSATAEGSRGEQGETAVSRAAGAYNDLAYTVASAASVPSASLLMGDGVDDDSCGDGTQNEPAAFYHMATANVRLEDDDEYGGGTQNEPGASIAAYHMATATPVPGEMDRGLVGGSSGISQFDGVGAPTLKESAEIVTALLNVVASFCGQALVDNPHSCGDAGDTSLSAIALSTNTSVAFTTEEQAAFAVQQAEQKEAARKVLLKPNGELAEAAAVFVEGRADVDLTYATESTMTAFEEQMGAATTWLIQAIQVAYLDPEIAAAVKQLLGTLPFTRSLQSGVHWGRLQTELSKIMAEIGERRLAPLYERFGLRSKLNTAAVGKEWSVHPDAVAAAYNLGTTATTTTRGKLKKPSQEVALPALIKVLRRKLHFDVPAEMAERVSLHVMRILTALLNDRFQDKMAAAAKAAGCKHHRAFAKGYARSLVKLYKDYLQLPSPRAAYVLDGLRTLLTGDSVHSIHAAIREINRLFGGLVQLKNPFTLTGAQQAARCHLLLLNLTGIADFEIDFGTLLSEPGTERVMAELREAPDGEPASRWRAHFDQAKALLNDASLKRDPVKLCVEVQITLTSSAEARGEMHYAYDVGRADDPMALFTNFAGVVEEEVATNMMDACMRGQLPVVQRLLAKKQADESDLLPDELCLTIAVQGNHPDVVGFLLDNGADASPKDADMCPLTVAAQYGFGDVVAQLLAANADVNQETTTVLYGAFHGATTPLCMALGAGHENVVSQLLAANADANQAMTDTGATPLCIAAQYGHENVVAQLVAANADVNQVTTSDGATPLFIAANNGHENVVAQLVAANADVNQAMTDTGATPLSVAAANGHEKVAAQLVAANADVNQVTTSDGATPLFIAANNGHENVVAQLVAANADVNQAPNDGGWTPLSVAAANGHEKVAAQLVAANADVTLSIAAASGYEKVVAQLVAANADVNQVTTSDGATPLFMAANNGHENVVAQLVALNADVKQGTIPDGVTPLFIAANNGHENVVAQLVAANADVNQVTTNDGSTPLIMAANNGHENVVAQLVAANADVNQAMATAGATPLYAAVNEGHERVVAQLVAANADVNQARTDNGESPLGGATRISHAAIVTMLVEAGAT